MRCATAAQPRARARTFADALNVVRVRHGGELDISGAARDDVDA
jgi:hypothetical protein